MNASNMQVIIPVNDNTDPDTPGGSHWSVLCYVKLHPASLLVDGAASATPSFLLQWLIKFTLGKSMSALFQVPH
jgi:hypothetical protein